MRCTRSVPKLIFISHATADLAVATDVRSLLRILGFDSFVAHVDIELSQDWISKILDTLRKCDGLVYLLSESSQNSDWTDQEVGCAIDRDIPIIPLSINVGPWGFVSRFQAKRWVTSASQDEYNRIKPNVRSLGAALVERDLLSVNGLIEMLGNSESFTDAIIRQIVLERVKQFSYNQLNWIMELVANNENLYNCTTVRRWVSRLLSENRETISAGRVAALRQVGIRSA